MAENITFYYTTPSNSFIQTRDTTEDVFFYLQNNSVYCLIKDFPIERAPIQRRIARPDFCHFPRKHPRNLSIPVADQIFPRGGANPQRRHKPFIRSYFPENCIALAPFEFPFKHFLFISGISLSYSSPVQIPGMLLLSGLPSP